MLDYFKISKEDTVIIDESDLRQATKDIFLKFGLSESNADLCTDVLLHADLRGIETHGVSNMLRTYVQMYQEGKSNPNPKQENRFNKKLSHGASAVCGLCFVRDTETGLSRFQTRRRRAARCPSASGPRRGRSTGA